MLRQRDLDDCGLAITARLNKDGVEFDHKPTVGSYVVRLRGKFDGLTISVSQIGELCVNREEETLVRLESLDDRGMDKIMAFIRNWRA